MTSFPIMHAWGMDMGILGLLSVEWREDTKKKPCFAITCTNKVLNKYSFSLSVSQVDYQYQY